MQINSIRHVLTFFMAVLIFSMPVITFAQHSSIETEAKIKAEARAQAIADAENDADKTAWFVTGCFLNILGVLIAQASKAPVPAERLVGKPPAYVAAYTSSYQAKRTEIQAQSAQSGCIVASLGCVAVLILVNRAADNSFSSSSSSSGGSGSNGGFFGNWCAF